MLKFAGPLILQTEHPAVWSMCDGLESSAKDRILQGQESVAWISRGIVSTDLETDAAVDVEPHAWFQHGFRDFEDEDQDLSSMIP